MGKVYTLTEGYIFLGICSSEEKAKEIKKYRNSIRIEESSNISLSDTYYLIERVFDTGFSDGCSGHGIAVTEEEADQIVIKMLKGADQEDAYISKISFKINSVIGDRFFPVAGYGYFKLEKDEKCEICGKEISGHSYKAHADLTNFKKTIFWCDECEENLEVDPADFYQDIVKDYENKEQHESLQGLQKK